MQLICGYKSIGIKINKSMKTENINFTSTIFPDHVLLHSNSFLLHLPDFDCHDVLIAFSHPISTFIIISSTMEVITFTIMSCAVLSRHLLFPNTSTILSITLCCRSITLLGCTFIMDIFWLQEIVSSLSLNNLHYNHDATRTVAVVAASSSLCRDIITIIMSVKILKQNSTILFWSYREHRM